MMLVISPAKKLNFKPLALKEKSNVRFAQEMNALVKVMKTKKSGDLMKLMDISKTLADLNVRRYKEFDPKMPESKTKQAIFAFNGDVYQGLKAEDFDSSDIKFAQDHVRILSGLYGLLKPLDMIQEYRLEMGSQLKNGKNKNLYEFWGDKITDQLLADMKDSKDKTLINLASEEYFTAVNTNKFKDNLITVRFEELRSGDYKVISFNAKKARGYMARYIIKNRLKKAEDIKHFSEEKYQYMAKRSTTNTFTFVR
ncbi:MAG: peroxide stress protein YaaA [Saprospiraceae bacterium]